MAEQDPRTLLGWDQLSRERQIDVLVEWAVFEQQIVALDWPSDLIQEDGGSYWVACVVSDPGPGWPDKQPVLERKGLRPQVVGFYTTNWTTLPVLLKQIKKHREVDMHSESDKWFCGWGIDQQWQWAEAPTLLMAVCLAALRALGVEV